MIPKLRDYQEKALREVALNLRLGDRRQIICAPTGAGKTTIAASFIAAMVRRHQRVLFLAHRRELIQQCSARLDLFGLEHGIIMAGTERNRPTELIQVASVQTLIRRKANPFNVIIVDEAHRTMGATYLKLLEQISPRIVIGLTATPARLDGKPLGAVYGKIVETASMKTLIKRGYLTYPVVYAPPSFIEGLDKVRMKGGDYDPEALADVVDRPKHVGDRVETWLKYAAGRQTIVFGVNRAHAQHLRDAFNEHPAFSGPGYVAAYLDGDTNHRERMRYLAPDGDLNTGRITVLCNVGVLQEGYDCPPVSCISLSHTMSETRYLQSAGRGLRPHEGQKDCIILDHGNCTENLGYLSMPREWSLEDHRKPKTIQEEAAIHVRTCKNCFNVYDSRRQKCPLCGYENPKKVKPIKTASGELVEVDESDPVTAIKIVYRHYHKIARDRGYRSASRWAYRRVLEEFPADQVDDIVRMPYPTGTGFRAYTPNEARQMGLA